VSDVVERYLDTLTRHDWDGLAACLAPDFSRTGPYGDTYPSKDEYLAFISALMPTLRGYAMDVARVTYTADGRHATAELSETVELRGESTVTPEALVFDLTGDGLIARVRIYIQQRA
jgi:ketosteroid isomerase-like protein